MTNDATRYSRGRASHRGMVIGPAFHQVCAAELGIYHCQHCEGSEWSRLMDMEKIASISEDTGEFRHLGLPPQPDADRASRH